METAAQRLKRLYWENPDYRKRKLEYQRRHYREHKDKERAYESRRYHEDAEYRKKHKKQAIEGKKRRHRKIRELLIKKLGGRCEICHTCDQRVLVIHHPEGPFNQHKNKLQQDYESWKAGKLRLQLLCANCHMIAHST